MFCSLMASDGGILWFGLVFLISDAFLQVSVSLAAPCCPALPWFLSCPGLAVLQVLCGVPAGGAEAGLPAEPALAHGLDAAAQGGAQGVRGVPAASPAASGAALPRRRHRQPPVRVPALVCSSTLILFSLEPLGAGLQCPACSSLEK